MKLARVGDVMEFVVDGTHGSPERTDVGIPVLSAQNVRNGFLDFHTDRFTSRREYEAFANRVTVATGDVLLTIVGTIGRAAVVDQVRPLVFQRSVAVLRPKSGVLWPRFMYHVTQSAHFQSQLARSSNQSSQAGVYLGKLKELLIPLPAIKEQGRIADILDKADALRAKRRAALPHLDALAASIFLKMFGDPAEKPARHVTTRFGDVLDAPLRNGVSPSTFGTIGRKVLTLSAISRDRFDETAVKEGLFESARNVDNFVDVRDFLICRGNGNLRMVGKGRYPSRSMPDVVFPDTMIAARLSPNRVEPLFLEQVWNSTAIRQQIESLARTTNGTFKVNQTILEDIRIVTPPLERQRAFAAQIRQIRDSERLQRESRSYLDALFASLQHRAFRGEL